MSFNDDPRYDYAGDDLPDLNKVLRMDRYTCIDSKLASIANEAVTPPVWLDAWRLSTRGRTSIRSRPEDEAGPEERLAVWKAIRDSGDLPEDATFCLMADQAEFLTELEVGEAMERIDKATDQLWTENGFAEWRSRAHRDSEDFLEFRERCPADWDSLYLSVLHRHGEAEMARLYKADRECFEQRVRSGQAYFDPTHQQTSERVGPLAEAAPLPPDWVQSFADDLSASGCVCLVGYENPASMRYSVSGQGEDTEVWLNIAPGEFVGGPRDGEKVLRTFFLDIVELAEVFDEIVKVQWFPFGSDLGAGGCHVRVGGIYRGHRLALYFLSEPLDEPEEYDRLEVHSA